MNHTSDEAASREDDELFKEARELIGWLTAPGATVRITSPNESECIVVVVPASDDANADANKLNDDIRAAEESGAATAYVLAEKLRANGWDARIENTNA